MIHLHLWTTPNGMKPLLFVEEAGLKYDIHWVDIRHDEQFAPEFLAISPNNKIPALVDEDPLGGGHAVTVFESGAILLYLAEKADAFIPDSVRGRIETLEWLFWQVGGVGPMAGQNHHFRAADEELPYAIERFGNEVARLYGVLDRRLADRAYVAGPAYTIADMAIFPWIVPYEGQGIDLAHYPNVEVWFGRVRDRPAIERAYARATACNPEALTPPGLVTLGDE